MMHYCEISSPVGRLLLTGGEEGLRGISFQNGSHALEPKNDAAVMDRILADDFILVTGKGKIYTKADLLADARSGKTVYEHQDDSSQKVRVWGDTAVVTALLRAKGTTEGKPFEYKLWFSGTYFRTPSGWRYVFGQASSPLPDAN